jgi:hypothetical protein
MSGKFGEAGATLYQGSMVIPVRHQFFCWLLTAEYDGDVSPIERINELTLSRNWADSIYGVSTKCAHRRLWVSPLNSLVCVSQVRLAICPEQCGCSIPACHN